MRTNEKEMSASCGAPFDLRLASLCRGGHKKRAMDKALNEAGGGD